LKEKLDVLRSLLHGFDGEHGICPYLPEVFGLGACQLSNAACIPLWLLAQSTHYSAPYAVIQFAGSWGEETGPEPVFSFLRMGNLAYSVPELHLGVILPHREGIQRTVPGSLKQYANWMRHVVTNVELAEHQFPLRIPTRKKPIDKPSYW
jgi:hypothetical protein